MSDACIILFDNIAHEGPIGRWNHETLTLSLTFTNELKLNLSALQATFDVPIKRPLHS